MCLLTLRSEKEKGTVALCVVQDAVRVLTTQYSVPNLAGGRARAARHHFFSTRMAFVASAAVSTARCMMQFLPMAAAESPRRLMPA